MLTRLALGRRAHAQERHRAAQAQPAEGEHRDRLLVVDRLLGPAEARRELIEQAATELFAERGYRAAAMSEIARRSGVTVPVVYDHFASKQDLHRRLLERHFADLQRIWTTHMTGEGSAQDRLARAVGAWFSYVETHPYAWRMLFRETTGDPEIEAIHRDVAERSRDTLLPLVAREGGASSPVEVELLWEVFRAALQGLALWWYEHREVPREQVVAAAMNGLWLGLDRFRGGERWAP